MSVTKRLLFWVLVPALALGTLLVGVPVAIFLLIAFAGGPVVVPPNGKPANQPAERTAQFSKALKDLAAGKRDRRELRVSMGHDGKKITGDGAFGGYFYGHGPGVLNVHRPIAVGKVAQDEILDLLTEFPWQEVESGRFGDVGNSDAAVLSIHIRLAEWDKTIIFATLQQQKSIYDPQGKADADKAIQLGKRLREVMEKARQVDRVPPKEFDHALTRIANGEDPEEWLTVGFQYSWKPNANAKKDEAPAKGNNAGDPLQPPADRAEQVFVANNGPIVWARKKNSGDLPTLVLPAKELRDLATFLKEIKLASLSADLEKAPHPNPHLARFQRPGLAPNRRWKTNFDFSVHILDKNLGYEIQDLEELPPQQRRPFEQIRERFEKLEKRIQQDGKVMTHL